MANLNKSIIFVILLLSFSTTLVAQIAPGKYVVFYNTKAGTPYSLEQPEAFLTDRAIQRRVKQNIAIDSTDMPVNPAFVDSLEVAGADVRFSSRWFNFTIVDADEAIMESIENYTFVHSVSKKNEPKAHPQKQDSKYEQELKQAFYGPGYQEVQNQINLEPLHNLGYRGANMRIAIIDAGFSVMNTMSAFAHLYDEGRIIATANFAEDTTVYYAHTHGTAVGSIMCADLGSEYKGAATEAEYVLIRSETGSSEYLAEEYSWVAAAEFADSIGADVINSSLGYSTFDWPAQNHSLEDLDGQTTIVSRAAGKAFKKGILVVVSAGNLGNDPWQYVSVPADNPDVLTVGSVDINGTLSGFSSIGLPEHNFKPDVVACGELAPYVISDIVYNGNGTSFSSPLVAAAAACLWQAFPELSNQTIASAIRNSGSIYPNGNNIIGNGIPDFEAAYANLETATLLPDDTAIAECISIYADKQGAIHLHIYTPDNSFVSLRIYDMHGKIITTHKATILGGEVNEIVLPSVGKPSKGQFIIVNLDGPLINESRKIFVD
ncbi:MAG TPA: S8 family serine peptidase [Salinivirga sp.]|uniref:S8 family serine peptidase n=1 Tax=Salinivirga sp. TaxID=1970192 RepID=UPI002B481D1A|nr:S8 family serine peptidase [Salinivirga sp.]HKK59305.1 S8 family serine peptidase [Salinivirga sp.]